MTIQTLSSVTLATIENYRHAATVTARAYRKGGHRFIDALNATLERNVDPRTSEFVPRLTEAVSKVRGGASEMAVKRIDEVSSLAERALDFGYDGAAKQVQRIADFAAGVESPVLASGLQAVARLSLPSAKVALVVSERINEGAKTLSSVASGRKSVQGAADEVATAAARQVERTQRKATKAAREAGETVRAAARAPRKTIARATRGAEAAVSEAVEAVEAAVAPVARKPRAKRAAAA